MDEDELILRPSNKIIGDNSIPSGPPGVEMDEIADNNGDIGKVRPPSPPAIDEKSQSRYHRSSRSPSNSHSRGRNTRRSSSPKRRTSRRSRSHSRSASRSPGYRRRTRISRDASRERNRSPVRRKIRSRSRGRNRSNSRVRYRGRRSRSRSTSRGRGNWKGKKLGPVSPPLAAGNQPPVVPIQTPFSMPPQQPMMNYAYNNYQSDVPAYGTSMPGYNNFQYNQNPLPTPFTTNYGVPPPAVQIPGHQGMIQTTDYTVNAPPQWGVPAPTAHIPPIHISANPEHNIPVGAPVVQPKEDNDNLEKRNAAIEQEKKNQQEALKKQRLDYKRRVDALKNELKILKESRNDFDSNSEPLSPTTKKIVRENEKLQVKLQGKIATMENVIELLGNIIGEGATEAKKTKTLVKDRGESNSDDSSPERLKTKVIESLIKNKVEGKGYKGDTLPSNKKEEDDRKHSAGGKKINYVFYDPEMHWCDKCDEFPKTAKDYLTHLHSKDHQSNVTNVEAPWHENMKNDDIPNYPTAPTKRTPIRGLQFFTPVSGWFCKLCNFWMGDLHCASVHLKSKTHADKYTMFVEQNPHYEIDWMGNRQKAYEEHREKKQMPLVPPPPPTIASVPSPDSGLLDSIPLQINQKPIVSTTTLPLLGAKDKDTDSIKDEKRKKKKKRSEDRKEKKKKKRGKKKKHDSSSSSSSSSDSNDSDSEESNTNDTKKDDNLTASNSIRVAMRNLLKQHAEKPVESEETAFGKWTVVHPALPMPVPPPPTISANGMESKKTDDLMISQWNAPNTIISDHEKKLLEDLKGRLKKRENESFNKIIKEPVGKTKEIEKPQQPTREAKDSQETRKSLDKGRVNRGNDRRDSSDRGRDRDRDMRNYRKGGRSRSRSRSRSRHRRGDSRGRRSSSRGRRYHGRRQTRSSSRSRSRSRSRGRRIEKAIVRYPEFRPRVPEVNPRDTKKRRDDDKRKSPDRNRKKLFTSATNTNKKLPFIGRMPVFKKQLTTEEEKKDVEINPPQHIYSIQPDAVNSDDMKMTEIHHDNMERIEMEDCDDLMPDPMQFVSLMGAPPPPPNRPPPSNIYDDGPELPPGIDETEADMVPKPLNDAPPPRAGPLPKDFQDALSLIFPDPDQQKKDEPKTSTIPEGSIVSTGVEYPVLTAEELSQHGIELYGGYTAVGVPGTVPQVIDAMDRPLEMMTSHMDAIQPVPPPVIEIEEQVAELSEKERERRQELEELAMLGIDADDLAAQCL